MARTNTARKNELRTHEGAPAAIIKPYAQLRRSVLSCLLWEREFYESGEDIADRIMGLAQKVKLEELASLAVEARTAFNLRHVPLLLLVALAKRGAGNPLVANAVSATITRADEMSELLALYFKINGAGKNVSAAVKRGLARAIGRFDEYQLAKYDRDGAVKLRDVLRIVRPKPQDESQAALWGRAVRRELKTPDTWEVELSAGKDKKETFERLLSEGKLGYLALLRNLRNMINANVDLDLVRSAIEARKGAARVFPFRYVAAARHAPQLEPALDAALQKAIAELPALPGKTCVLIDVSGSMDWPLSKKSDMNRIDVAAALGAIVNCANLRLFTFSEYIKEVPPRRGMAGVDAIVRSQAYQGTHLGIAVNHVNSIDHDRLIVITDEQSHDRVPDPRARLAYMINVASAKNGVGYGRWTHIDGFSENVLHFIHEYEAAQ